MKARLTVLFLFVLAACRTTTVPPLRGVESMHAPITLASLEDRQSVTNEEGKAECSDPYLRRTSVERFVDANGHEFDIGVIEMNDDAHVSDDTQKRQVLRRLRDVATGKVEPNRPRGAVIVTFVHGWHHRSKVCDNNLACFRSVLKALSEAGGRDARPVFGIYLGWRGDTIKNPSFVSFYNRKATAHAIGHEAGREILNDLDDLYRQLNDQLKTADVPHPVTMVTAGHSFGGALVFSAVEGTLVRELRKEKDAATGIVPAGSDHVVGARPVDCNGRRIRPIRRGIGDLVILVNPAFEASRYLDFAKDELGDAHYAPGQLPVLLTMASEGDDAVKVAFPAGRTVYYAFHLWQRPSMSDIIGAGHYDPQTTHNLLLTDDAHQPIHPKPAEAPDVKEADADTVKRCDLHVGEGDFATCKCEYNVPANLADVLRQQSDLTLAKGSVRTADNENVSLVPRDANRDPHSPFLVVRVAPEIISKHSDIYTPRFLTFLTAYIARFAEQSKVQPMTDEGDDPRAVCSANLTAAAQ